MGTIFGKVSVEEPAFDVVLNRPHPPAHTSYEIRRYGERFAIEAEYDGTDNGTPFRLLAGYIGVFGDPQNEGSQSISMTAPVVTEKSKGGTTISMTAPVVTANNDENEGAKKMQFILPAEYDDINKIPKPTNPAVKITEVPPSIGAVHRYNGKYGEPRCQEMAKALTKQLNDDGIDISEADVLEKYQCWGYNPPWTIPMMKRNEIWIELSETQVDDLTQIFDSATAKN